MGLSTNIHSLRKKRTIIITQFVFLLLLTASAVAFIDLAVNSTNIAFSNNNPIEGENVNISALITNIGNETTTDVTIQYLDDTKEIGNVTINILNYSSATVSHLWSAEIGPNNISVIIDPDNYITESNETNNQASNKIFINAYHAYYGTTKSYVGLGIGSSFMFQTEFTGCNILVSDTDSSVDFSSLQAIGKKKNEGISQADFEEIDALLGMTDFSDSVTNLFSVKRGKMVPKQVETFTTFSTTIPVVPVINSTNSSAFLTGILWDTSDDTTKKNGEYDALDQEDLIFITKINLLQQGLYGIYNYEIKIPALLRNYKPGNPTVDFFIDIDSCSS